MCRNSHSWCRRNIQCDERGTRGSRHNIQCENEELEDTEHFVMVRVRDGLASFREPALSGSRYSGGCDGARGVRVRSEGDEIAKGIAGGGEREREIEEGLEGGLIRGWRRCWSWRWVAVSVMVIVMVVVALAVRDGNGRLPAAGPLDHTRWMTSLSGVTRIPGFGGEEDTPMPRSGLRVVNRD